jgi:hypothetical protein
VDDGEARNGQDEEPVSDGRHSPRNHRRGEALGERDAADLEQIGFDRLPADGHQRRDDVRRLADDVDRQKSDEGYRRPAFERVAPADRIADEDQEVRQKDQDKPPPERLEVRADPLRTDLLAQPGEGCQADHQEQIPDHNRPRVTETRSDSCRGHGCDILFNESSRAPTVT